MATTEKKDAPKRKPGRPKKVEVPPVVNEAANGEPTQIEMSSPAVSPAGAMQGLTSVWKRMLGTSSQVSNIYNLNQYNPFLQNDRLKRLSTLPATMSRDKLIKALVEPQNNEEALRAEAWAISSSQYMYYKILRLACDVPLYKWYVLPEAFGDKSDYKKPEFVSEDKYVNQWLRVFDLQNTLRRVALEVKREGKVTYVLRNSISGEGDKRKVNYAIWQKLPSNYVKLVKIGAYGYIAAFNMMIFLNPAFSPEQYPDFIQDIWADMISQGVIVNKQDKTYSFDVDKASEFSYSYNGSTLTGTIETITAKRLAKMAGSSYMFWVQLPQELCYTFCSDSSNAWAIPDTAGLLMSLDELADYDVLQGLVDSTPLTTLLTAEADLIKEPSPGQDQTALNPETICGLQSDFNEKTSTNLEAFFAPLKNFKLLSLPAQPNGSDISANATKNVITRAGLGGLMITTDKPSVAQVKTAQLLAEAEADFVTRQFECVLNMTINELIGCKYRWVLKIWGGRFSFSDEIARDKELFVAGAGFVLPKLASAYDMSLREVKSTQEYIDVLGIYDGFKTVTQVQQLENAMKQAQQTGKVGRPSVSDDKVDNDNTAASKDSGLDTSDTRSYDVLNTRGYVSNCFAKGECIICHKPTDDFICDECKEECGGGDGNA